MSDSPVPGRADVGDAGVAVFVSGVASMGLEILAGRLVTPVFGSSIYVWGSVIGVFLAALSVGYHHGGRRATARASTARLAWLLLGTAAYVAGLVVAGDRLLEATIALSLPSRFAALPGVTLLFGPPTYLLGFVSPYAAELLDGGSTGEAAGRVYMLGTAGSILGAFGTTFVLIPWLAVDVIALAYGGLLVATALYVLAPELPGRATLASLVVAGLLVAAGAGATVDLDRGGEPVYHTQTAYQELAVVDEDGVRTLYLDGHPHSAMDLEAPDRHVFAYTRYFHLPMLFSETPGEVERVLFVGGGGFTGPKDYLEHYDATVDVVEIDPAVVRTARRYFRVEESAALRIHVADGRRFLRRTDRTYDLVVLDAYRKDRVPFQLTTVEFMRLARERLDEDGVLYANLITATEGPASRLYRAEYRTMNRVFPQVYSFPTAGGGRAVQNVELVATRSPDRLMQAQLRERNRRRDLPLDLAGEIEDYRADVAVGDAPLLTDDHAPVDALLGPAVDRPYVLERTPENGTTATASTAAG